MKHNFNKLDAWQRSRKLVKEIYLTSSLFPKEERFGLSAQIRRCAVSIPSNIAEGCGRGTTKQLIYFLDIAIGSNCELETQLYLSFDLEYISESKLNLLMDEVVEIRKMIIRFSYRLQKEIH